MPILDQNITQFIELVRKGESIYFLYNKYFVRSRFCAFLRKVFKKEENDTLSLSKVLRQKLDALEKIPIHFSEKEQQVVQLIDFKSYIEATETVIDKLSMYSSREAVEERSQLERRKIALLYRLEKENGGLDSEMVESSLLDSICALAKAWKSSQVIFQESVLSYSEREILYKTCEFPLFVQLIFRDKKLLEEFFVWALRDRISIFPFIEFPYLQQKIVQADLNGRIGRLGGEKLKVQKREEFGEIYKVVTLPIQGKEENILNEERVILFRGNYALTISEIFHIFKNKQFEPGNLEYLQEGILNWNSHQLGWWDADLRAYQQINLNQNDWWQQLPVLEQLSLKQARQKFGTHLTGREWNIALISSRLTADLDFNNTHAYTSLAIPQVDGSYTVYAFGKFAAIFPKSMLEALFTLGRTLEAVVAYPEENVYYTHRQKARLSFAVTKEEALLYLDSVKRDLFLARDGHFVYQIESENCARWAYQKLEKAIGKGRIPDIFRMHLLQCEPHSFIELAFNCVRKLPRPLQKPALWVVHGLLGARHGKWIVENRKAVWKSLTHHTFWKDQIIFHPPRLHQQQENKLIGKFVQSGVTFIGRFISQIHSKLAYFLGFIASFFKQKSKSLLDDQGEASVFLFPFLNSVN